MTASSQATSGQTYPFSNYTYNRAGALTSVKYPSGRIVNTSYDGAGRPNSVTLGGSGASYVSAVTYAPHGAITQMNLGNGLTEATVYSPDLRSVGVLERRMKDASGRAGTVSSVPLRPIKGINTTTPADFDKSFLKYSGLLGSKGFIPRLAETAGHEFNHGIFAQQDPAQGVVLQKLLNGPDAALQALPTKGRYPLPPDVLQKMQTAEQALIPTERFAQQAEKIINGELKASQVK